MLYYFCFNKFIAKSLIEKMDLGSFFSYRWLR